MIKRIYAWLAIVLLFISFGALSQPRIGLKPFASGLLHPVDIKNAGDDRLFVVEQDGYIVILDSAGNAYPQPFLDIHDRVNHTGTEQGLLGLTFHPGFNTNGYFYVNYTGTGDSTHISRFRVSPSDPDSAMKESEFNLLTIYQPFTNHNGGELQFGPDGYLYIGLGDGGSAGDPGNRAQDLSQLLGKLLRIDVDGGTPYSIPPGNPFAGQPQVRPEIWSYGLRNPWRFSFDRSTGDLWIADVGQDSFEEVDHQPASSTGGENWGWRCYEGCIPYNTSGCLQSQYYQFPAWVYPHDTTPCWSITGGYVYRGATYPGFSGSYFFADYCKDSIWALSGNGTQWNVSLRSCFPGNNFSTFGENPYGILFIAGRTSGMVYKIIDAGPSGLSRQGFESGLNISPDPFSDRFRIIFPGGHSGTITASILDLTGREIIHTKVAVPSGWVETGSLSRGTYILRIRDELRNEKTWNLVVIKQ